MDDYAREVYVLKATELLNQLNVLDIDVLISKLNAALVASSVFYATDEKNSKRYNQASAFLILFESLSPLLSSFAYYNEKIGNAEELTDTEFDEFIIAMMNMAKLVPKMKSLTIVLAWYAPDFDGKHLAREKEDFIDCIETISAPAAISVESLHGIVTSGFNDGYENNCIVIPANLDEEVWWSVQLAKDEAKKGRDHYMIYAPLAYELTFLEKYGDVAVIFLHALFNVINHEKNIQDITREEIYEKEMDELIDMFKMDLAYMDMLTELEASYAELSLLIPLDEINQVRGSSFHLKMKAEDGDLDCQPILLDKNNFYHLAHDMPKTEEFNQYQLEHLKSENDKDIDY